jgi:GNAT superfamily N-acetyltransferase
LPGRSLLAKLWHLVTQAAPDPAHLTIRAIQPDDAPELKAAFEHWSRSSRHLRFHAGMQRLPPSLLHYLTHVDGVNHVALVAFHEPPGEPPVGVGVGRFVRLPDAPEVAELALSVTDDAQGHGVAARLTAALARAAAERGITRFSMEVLRENTRVCELLAGLGAEIRSRDLDVVSYSLPVATVIALAEAQGA